LISSFDLISSSFSFDSRGHVITERRNTNGVTKSTAYAYDFHGGVTSITYPSGRRSPAI
jgi:hypothetical protein